MKPRVKTLCLYIKLTDSHRLLRSPLLSFVLGVPLMFHPDATSFQIFHVCSRANADALWEPEKLFCALDLLQITRCRSSGSRANASLFPFACRTSSWQRSSDTARFFIYLISTYPACERWVSWRCLNEPEGDVCVGRKLGTDTLGTAPHFHTFLVWFGPPDLSVWTEPEVVWKIL